MSENKPVILMMGTGPGKSSAKLIRAQYEMGRLGINASELGGALGSACRMGANKPSLTEWFSRGAQCGKSEYQVNFIKYVMHEFIRQHPYRHMWE